jgi:opacity protein-like surface antigen
LKKILILIVLFTTHGTAQDLLRDEREEYRQEIKQLKERLQLVEDTLQTLLRERAVAAPLTSVVPARTPVTLPVVLNAAKDSMPPELVPEIGKIGAEVGITLNGSSNPYRLNRGTDVAGFIDLPLFDKPDWLHGKISYEISIGLSQSKTSFNTTSNVAQVANLTVLNTLNPNGGLQNLTDAIAGTGAAPFPVTSLTETKMKLLQVVPFSFKYTTTALDRFRLRPYALIGFGTYITIHSQSPINTGVRLNANLPASVTALVNQVYGGQAPFGGPLVAGQISQSPELEARGLPSGHGNINFGWLAGGGVEWRLTRSFSLGFDGRWNRIAGAPAALTTYGTRLGFHF